MSLRKACADQNVVGNLNADRSGEEMLRLARPAAGERRLRFSLPQILRRQDRALLRAPHESADNGPLDDHRRRVSACVKLGGGARMGLKTLRQQF